jgi:hypothetical protein
MKYQTPNQKEGYIMGAIRSAIKEFDPSSDSVAEQKALVEALAKLAEAKADFFEAEIRENIFQADANKTVPIEAILATTKETHAYAANVSDQIATEVGKSVNNFVSGGNESIVSGVVNLFSTALTAFLGGGTGATGTMEKYYVLTEGLSIVRFDVKSGTWN